MKEAGLEHTGNSTVEVLEPVTGKEEPEVNDLEAESQIRTEPRRLEEVPSIFREVEVLVPERFEMHEVPEGGFLIWASGNSGNLLPDKKRDNQLNRFRTETLLGEADWHAFVHITIEGFYNSEFFKEVLCKKYQQQIDLKYLCKSDRSTQCNMMRILIELNFQSFAKSMRERYLYVHGLMGCDRSMTGNRFTGELGWGLTEPLETFLDIDLNSQTANAAAIGARLNGVKSVHIVMNTNGFNQSGSHPEFDYRKHKQMRSTLAIADQLNSMAMLMGLMYEDESANPKNEYSKGKRNIFVGHSMGGIAVILALIRQKKIRESKQLEELHGMRLVDTVALPLNPAVISRWQSILFELIALGAKFGDIADIFAPSIVALLLQGTPKPLRSGVYVPVFCQRQDKKDKNPFKLTDRRRNLIAAALGLAGRHRNFPQNSLRGTSGVAITAARRRDRLVPGGTMKRLLEFAGWEGTVYPIEHADHLGYLGSIENILIYFAALEITSVTDPNHLANPKLVIKGIDHLVKYYKDNGIKKLSSHAVLAAIGSDDYQQFLKKLSDLERKEDESVMDEKEEDETKQPAKNNRLAKNVSEGDQHDYLTDEKPQKEIVLEQQEIEEKVGALLSISLILAKSEKITDDSNFANQMIRLAKLEIQDLKDLIIIEDPDILWTKIKQILAGLPANP